MSRKTKPPAPAVVSAGCSSLMSCISLHRRAAPQPSVDDDAEQYRKRVQLLEEEIRRLTKWLGHEERPAPAAAGSVKKLEDGSYLHEVSRRVGRPWERLAVQVSRPGIPEDTKSASEVLDKMTAMRAHGLCKFLTRMMPLKDIAGRQNPGEPVRRPARLSTGDDLVEALLFMAMDKMESLVMEGLKIQMTSAATDFAVAASDDRPASKNCMVHVVLIQVRDPKERYGAIGNPMIGLIQASLERMDGKVKLEMQGLHIAGISSMSRKSSDGRSVMWSASLRQCKGPHRCGSGGDNGCRCSCVRNPDRVFRR